MHLHNYPTASLIRRLAALAYDTLVIVALYIMSGFVLVAAFKLFTQHFPEDHLPNALYYSLLFCICFFYYSISWRKGGQTIGMKAWRIRLINTQNRPLALSQFMLRTACGLFSLLLFGLGYWWALVDKKSRTWHDIASLTRVVFMPKNMQ